MRDVDYGKHPRARIVWRASDLTNGDLLLMATAVAKKYAAQLKWPDELPAEDAGRIAWQYVRDHTRYYPERGTQMVRTPRAFVREGIGDCKTTAAYIAATAAAAGRDAALKFVRLPGQRHYGHVYAIVDGIAADPLLSYGDEPLYSSAHVEPIAMEGMVLNGAPPAPTNAAELYAMAYNMLKPYPSMMNGAAFEYGDQVRARAVVDHIDRRFPNWTWQELQGIPVMQGIWEDLHKATTNVTRENDWLKDAQRINPMMVPIRAALIELTKSNIGGIADMFAKARPEVLQAQWEAHGGKWDTFRKAIAHGKGRKGDDLPPQMNGPAGDVHTWVRYVNGRGPVDVVETWENQMRGTDDVYYMPGGNPADTTYYQPGGNPYATTQPPPQATPPISSGGSGWGGLWNVAGPLLNSLLGSATQAAGQALTDAIRPKPPQPPQPPQATPPGRPPVRPRLSASDHARVEQQVARLRAQKAAKKSRSNMLLLFGAGLAVAASTGAFSTKTKARG